MLGHNRSRAQPLLPGTNTPAGGAMPTARIRRSASSATQSGPGRDRWVLDFEPWRPVLPDPLMGWPVSTDPFAQIRLEFPDVERAIDFAEKQGWRYHLMEDGEGPPRPKLKVDPARLVWPFRDPDLFERCSTSPASDRRDGEQQAVDTALEHTFPASDPPCWMLGHGRG